MTRPVAVPEVDIARVRALCDDRSPGPRQA